MIAQEAQQLAAQPLVVAGPTRIPFSQETVQEAGHQRAVRQPTQVHLGAQIESTGQRRVMPFK